MSTIKEIIQRVDDVKPNCFPESIKLRWISLLDGKVAEGVYLLDALEARSLTYQYPEDLQHEPLIDFPYDDLYDLFLQAKIDFENGEYSKYQNTMEMFNSHYYDFVRWMAETYDPAQGGNRMGGNTYLLSAYALAVKHGFQGSEKEWLQSLFGKSVELRSKGSKIQWRHEGDEQWVDLVELSDERYFQVTADGVLSLKNVYRGAFPSNRVPENFPYGVSDKGKDAAGSRNAELPQNIVIPDTVGGVKVKSIAGGAFAGNLMLESISIPDTVEEIPRHCFENCRNLKSVHAVGVKRIERLALAFTGIETANFPNVTYIGNSAFSKSRVKEVNLPSLAKDGMGQTAFDYCLQLETVNAGNLTTVPIAAFFNCCNLQTVSCKEGIVSIGVSAFAGTPKLTAIDISKATGIHAYAFHRSGFEFDWKKLSDSGCAFGICATSEQLNPTDIWSGLTIKECENPLPTLFYQRYSGWANKTIGTTGKHYYGGCALFSFIHAYCGLRNIKLESVEDFESIADSYEEGILNKFKASMSHLYRDKDDHPPQAGDNAGFCSAFGLSYEHGQITSKENLQEIYDALADGKYVIIEVGTISPVEDYASLKGHAALIYGVRKDGKLLVADSGIGSKESPRGNTSAIHYKSFLHTGEADGPEGVNATDYYIISNGEATMSIIGDKLDALTGMVANIDKGFRTESGFVEIPENITPDATKVGEVTTIPCSNGNVTVEYASATTIRIKIPCSAGAKTIDFHADKNTLAEIEATSAILDDNGKCTTPRWLGSVLGNFFAPDVVALSHQPVSYTSVMKYEAALAAYAAYNNGWVLSDASIVGDDLNNENDTPNIVNTDGVKFLTFALKAGRYEWTAYYWND